MKGGRHARRCVMVIMCAVAATLHAQFGFPGGQSQEPSLYDQATGKVRMHMFGAWAEFQEANDPDYGDVLLYRYHVMDMSKAAEATDKSEKPNWKNLETQTIDLLYPYAHIFKQYKSEGSTNKLYDFIKQKDPAASENIAKDQNFLRATVSQGIGKGVCLRLVNGKYDLWSGAPAAFGKHFDTAGLVIRDRNYFLYGMNRNETWVTVFLSPTKAERHHANGTTDTPAATNGRTPSLSINVIGMPQGAYSRKVCGTIGQRWTMLIEKSGADRQPGKVKIKFTLHPDGRVTNLVSTRHAVSAAFENCCQKAVLESAPFDAWPEELKQLAGTHLDIAIEFVVNAQ